jgi:hypothetical protein
VTAAQTFSGAAAIVTVRRTVKASASTVEGSLTVMLMMVVLSKK